MNSGETPAFSVNIQPAQAAKVNNQGISTGLPSESSTGIAVVFGRDMTIYFFMRL